MLNAVRRTIACHGDALTLSVRALLRAPLTTSMTVLVVAIALALPALFWVLMTTLQMNRLHAETTPRIALYLKLGVSVAEQRALCRQVQAMAGVREAILVTPEQGLAFLDSMSRQSVAALPENPLPAVIDVMPVEAMRSPEQLSALLQTFAKLAPLDHAQLDMQWVNRLYAVVQFAQYFMHALMVLLGLSVVIIISNTVRLAVQNRYVDVQVLKFIGASNAFIVRPFVYIGLGYGMLGACGALVLLQGFCLGLSPVLRQLQSAYQGVEFGVSMGWMDSMRLVGSSVILSGFSAWLAAKRQLVRIDLAW